MLIYHAKFAGILSKVVINKFKNIRADSRHSRAHFSFLSYAILRPLSNVRV